MKGSHLFWVSRSKGMTVDIWIRDYNPPIGFSRRKSLAGVNIMVTPLFARWQHLSLGFCWIFSGPQQWP
jgi:hypothetical protein